MKYVQELKIDHELAATLTRLLNEPDADCGRDEPVFDREVVFSNGYRMAIQVIASTEPSRESCWSQGVLFDSIGNELGCTEVGESLLGSFTVADGVDEYEVIVLEG